MATERLPGIELAAVLIAVLLSLPTCGGRDAFDVITVAGQRPFRLHARTLQEDGGSLNAQLHRYGVYDGTKMRLLEQLFPLDPAPESRRVFVDAGANIGLFSLMVAARGHDVIAFEPSGDNRALFEGSIAANGLQDRITLRPVAVSDGARPGAGATLRCLGHDMGGCTLRPERSAFENAGDLLLSDVAVTTLGEAVPPGSKVVCIKVDVEGMEGHVLVGALPVLLDSRDYLSAMFFEFAPASLRLAGVEPVWFLTLLHRLGFVIYDQNMRFATHPIRPRHFDTFVRYCDDMAAVSANELLVTWTPFDTKQ